MCIIVAKKKGLKWPKISVINTCCDNNPDGFSVAWNEDGKLKSYKTLSKSDFIQLYKHLTKLNCNDTACVLHARIMTHGSKKTENCHCWTSNGLAFAHNGILKVEARDDMTDSETFFRDIFIPSYVTGGWPCAKRAIKACIGYSKFAFIDESGELYTFGQYIKDHDILYSNSSYIPLIRTVFKYSTKKRRAFERLNASLNEIKGILHNKTSDYDEDDYYEEDLRFKNSSNSGAFSGGYVEDLKKNNFGDYEVSKNSQGDPIYWGRTVGRYYRINNLGMKIYYKSFNDAKAPLSSPVIK